MQMHACVLGAAHTAQQRAVHTGTPAHSTQEHNGCSLFPFTNQLIPLAKKKMESSVRNGGRISWAAKVNKPKREQLHPTAGTLTILLLPAHTPCWTVRWECLIWVGRIFRTTKYSIPNPKNQIILSPSRRYRALRILRCWKGWTPSLSTSLSLANNRSFTCKPCFTSLKEKKKSVPLLPVPGTKLQGYKWLEAM